MIDHNFSRVRFAPRGLLQKRAPSWQTPLYIKTGTLVSIIASSVTEYFDGVDESPDKCKKLNENDAGIIIHCPLDEFGGVWYHVLFESCIIWVHGASLKVIK